MLPSGDSPLHRQALLTNHAPRCDGLGGTNGGYSSDAETYPMNLTVAEPEPTSLFAPVPRKTSISAQTPQLAGEHDWS